MKSEVPLSDSDLVDKINLVFVPSSLLDRYKYLSGLLNDERISESEHADLVEIIDMLDRVNLERLVLMTQLADLRGVTLDQVMVDLGIGLYSFEAE